MIQANQHADDEEEEHDNLEPVSSDNIIAGGRTRGRNIDFAQAAEKAKNEGDEVDEDDDDEDFQGNDDDDQMRD